MNATHIGVPTGVPNSAAALAAELRRQRQYTLALYADLPAPLWNPPDVPYLKTVNPPLWELAHIAWFAEFFALRNPVFLAGGTMPPSRLSGADQLFDSGRIAHAQRWKLPYPERQRCFEYMQEVLDDCAGALETGAGLYEFQLALLHEDMHGEALAITLNTLGLPLPATLPAPGLLPGAGGDIHFPGGEFTMGDATGRGFLFDNEKPAHVVRVDGFSIAARPVSASEFAEFADGPAYRERRFWSEPGWQWLQQGAPTARTNAAGVAMHMNAYEAEAYCCWAGRRLPTEAEWEYAAVHLPGFLASAGAVWEWTSSPFAPFPGFSPDIYQDYSRPWFYDHRVLKGGSFLTHPRLKYPQYRNFYTPDRRDMFCGFRTCATQE